MFHQFSVFSMASSAGQRLKHALRRKVFHVFASLAALQAVASLVCSLQSQGRPWVLAFARPNFQGSKFANWISDSVMLGRYPYVEPSRLPDPAAGKARLAKLLDADIDVFVSLVSELPPQSQHEGDIEGFGGYKKPVLGLASGQDKDFAVRERDVRFLHFPTARLVFPFEGTLASWHNHLFQN
eukprot:TRINITY_DN12795_c0_g1_i4.p1 TRINITY_DN12795_c0_g1~~TRINITY_DN12795_c0_g1_i4.p1  ORF type:complete len:183 (+),score=18.92 TRINITY_DN12795_c0_g1_i4:12-560(+)